MDNGFIKCGIDNNCLNKCIYHTLQIYKIHLEIVSSIIGQKEIKISLIKELQETYKIFSKDFFSKKTVDCMKKYCKRNFPNIIEDIQKLLNKSNFLRNQIIKHYRSKHNRIYIRILDVSIEIIHDFSEKYKKKYLEIK